MPCFYLDRSLFNSKLNELAEPYNIRLYRLKVNTLNTLFVRNCSKQIVAMQELNTIQQTSLKISMPKKQDSTVHTATVFVVVNCMLFLSDIYKGVCLMPLYVHLRIQSHAWSVVQPTLTSHPQVTPTLSLVSADHGQVNSRSWTIP